MHGPRPHGRWAASIWRAEGFHAWVWACQALDATGRAKQGARSTHSSGVLWAASCKLQTLCLGQIASGCGRQGRQASDGSVGRLSWREQGAPAGSGWRQQRQQQPAARWRSAQRQAGSPVEGPAWQRAHGLWQPAQVSACPAASDRRADSQRQQGKCVSVSGAGLCSPPARRAAAQQGPRMALD